MRALPFFVVQPSRLLQPLWDSTPCLNERRYLCVLSRAPLCIARETQTFMHHVPKWKPTIHVPLLCSPRWCWARSSPVVLTTLLPLSFTLVLPSPVAPGKRKTRSGPENQESNKMRLQSGVPAHQYWCWSRISLAQSTQRGRPKREKGNKCFD